ncbi:MAG: T9SS type A sorting domain-containing protein [Vicingaceae bacterium]|nr:T9SS type A sorting domain-containing protein [Flavobacteriales bacterium]MDF1674709.1 T9SS type A sorting domain-containing protein [Vicingaceae bacterium]
MIKIKLVVFFILSNTLLFNAQNVSINALNVNQTMEGFGTSLRVFNDPHIIGGTTSDPITAGLVISTAQEDTILNLLYNELGLTRVRPATGEDGSIEDPNDNNDPDSTDLTQFDFSWKRMDAHIDYVSRVIPRGVDTYFPSTIKLESWMTTSNPEEYAEWAFNIIKRWKDQGYELPYYSIINEPGYSRGGIWPGTYIRDCIKLLGPKLDTAGISTKIVIPDDLNANEAYTRSQIIMADTLAQKYVGALAYHLYGGSSANKTAMMQLGQQYNVPVWMTEYSRSNAFDWGNQIHDVIANYNVSAVDHMWGFFGEQETNGTQFISLNFSGTNYTGYTINKQYYVTGQYSKYIQPGSQRIDATSSDIDVRVTAYKEGADIAIVVINNDVNPKTVDFAINGMNLSTLKAVRTSQTENWTILPDITLANDSFTTTLTANSITTFYSELTTSVQDVADKSSSFIIYPNPFNDFAIVELKESSDNWSWTLYNSFGQKVQEIKKITNQRLIINKGDLPVGIYLYDIQVKDKLPMTGKLIIK